MEAQPYKTKTVSIEAGPKMLRKITAEIGAAVRVIVVENRNVVRSFVKDVASLLTRFGQPQKKRKTA